MSDKTFRERPYFTFLSHAHADKVVVDRINDFLSRCAGIPVWYDSTHIQASEVITSKLPEYIEQCRSMMLIISESSINSGWIREERDYAMLQRAKHHKFQIIPVLIDKKLQIDRPPLSDFMGFINATKSIIVDFTEPEKELVSFANLIKAFYCHDPLLKNSRDVYVSRSWRESEAPLSDKVCRCLIEKGFRLIGDLEDQTGFDKGDRVSSIMASCGGFVAIVPDRGGGTTSKYILKEVEIAASKNLPCLIVAEPTVKFPETFGIPIVRITSENIPSDIPDFRIALESFIEEWNVPGPEMTHYVFYATDIDKTNQSRNTYIKEIIQSVTAMPCMLGEDIREDKVQESIINRINNAYFMIADISEDNLNTCIEAGIARGTCTKLYLIAKEPRRSPPFMFRDSQVFHYANNSELLGLVHRIIYPHRRRVINHELDSNYGLNTR